jgi:kinesin family protein C2/C3
MGKLGLEKPSQRKVLQRTGVGVNYGALEVLFNTSSKRSSDVAYGFSVSVLEVYNERIRDLLAESTGQTAKK